MVSGASSTSDRQRSSEARRACSLRVRSAISCTRRALVSWSAAVRSITRRSSSACACVSASSTRWYCLSTASYAASRCRRTTSFWMSCFLLFAASCIGSVAFLLAGDPSSRRSGTPALTATLNISGRAPAYLKFACKKAAKYPLHRMTCIDSIALELSCSTHPNRCAYHPLTYDRWISVNGPYTTPRIDRELLYFHGSQSGDGLGQWAAAGLA